MTGLRLEPGAEFNNIQDGYNYNFTGNGKIGYLTNSGNSNNFAHTLGVNVGIGDQITGSGLGRFPLGSNNLLPQNNLKQDVNRQINKLQNQVNNLVNKLRRLQKRG